ncbi:MAG: hypothetical protein M1832_005534 [Thelocarpon impressellum]|nr:MAG: hypothetical protein M1832_005534 [Thelocarpon impressellum]
MNTLLDPRFTRLESALNSLLDSLSSYNPSPAAAHALLEADDSLTDGLAMLSTHQQNHARIAALQTTAAAQAAQIARALTLLSETRKDLLATRATTLPAGARDVPYDELLAYAKRIAKFTVPPTASSRPAPTPVAGGHGVGVEALPRHESEWVNPAQPACFIPWPSDETIRRGGLAGLEAGVHAEGDAQMGEADGEGQEERGAEEGRPEQAGEGRERAEHRPAEKPAVFSGLDLYNPDDD